MQCEASKEKQAATGPKSDAAAAIADAISAAAAAAAGAHTPPLATNHASTLMHYCLLTCILSRQRLIEKWLSLKWFELALKSTTQRNIL
jgi:hypothetical protein